VAITGKSAFLLPEAKIFSNFAQDEMLSSDRRLYFLLDISPEHPSLLLIMVQAFKRRSDCKNTSHKGLLVVSARKLRLLWDFIL